MPVPSPAERPGRPEVLRAVFGATFLVRFAFGLSLSVFASYLSGSSVGIDPAAVGTVGIVASLAPVGEFSTVLLSGGLSDRVGRYPILVGAIGIAALIMLGISLSRDAVWLGALSFGFGVTSGAILTASLAVVGDEAGALERGYEMGRFDAVNLLGWILGFAVGFGLLGSVANADLGGLFLLAAAVLGGGFVYSNRALRRGTERSAGARRLSALALLRTVFRREILLVTLPWFVIYLLLGTLFVFLGSAATGVGVSAEVLALAIGIGGLLLLLTQPYFGRLSDRYGPMRLMTVGTIGFVGVLTGAALLATYGALPVLLGLVAASALPALAYGPAALAALADLSVAYSRGTTMAIYTLTISVGMLGGIFLSTALFSALGAPGLDLYFGGIAGGLVLLTALRYRDLRRGDSGRPVDPEPVRTPVR